LKGLEGPGAARQADLAFSPGTCGRGRPSFGATPVRRRGL